MNIQRIFTGARFMSYKKTHKFLKKLIFSFLIACFFVGGIFPLVSVFSGTSEFSENFGVESAYAGDTADANAGETKDLTARALEDAKAGKMSTDLKQKISEFAALMISIFTPILAILIKLIESLMSDSYVMGINGNEGGIPIAQVLYELWVVFRDIMNYLFILVLLFFAFMNVIAPIADNDNFALKTVLPKMIMAIVVINLTWFGARVVFDVVDVSARVVFGLPQSIMEGKYGEALDPSKNKCLITEGVGTNKFASMKGLCSPAYINLNSPEKKNCTKKIGEKNYIKEACFPFTPREDDSSCSDIQKVEGVKYYPSTCSMYGAELQEGGGQKAFDSLIEKKQEKKTEACKKNDKGDIANKSECERLESSIKTLNTIKANKVLKEAVNYGPVTVYWSDFDYDDFNQGTIAPMFAFSIMQIQNLPRIANTQYQSLTNEGAGWSTLVINILISLVIMIILLVLFSLMVINLFFRIIVLWINIIFSPFYGLLIFKEQLNLDGAESEYLGLSAFIKHAFAPVIMGLPLVVGFIMITVGKQYGIVKEGGNFGIDTPMIDNVSNLHQLFYYILAIVVLWVGGVKAIEATSSEFVNSTFISPIKDGVTSAAKFVATAPMYINFIPVAGKDGEMGSLNLSQLGDISDSFESNRRRQSQRELTNLGLTGDGQGFLDQNELLIKRLDSGDKNGVKNGLEKLMKGKTMNDSISAVKGNYKKDFTNILKKADTIGKMEKLLAHYGIEGVSTTGINNIITTVSGGNSNKDDKDNKKSENSTDVKVEKVADVPEEDMKKIKGKNSTKDQKVKAITNIFNITEKDSLESISTGIISKYIASNELSEISDEAEKKEIIKEWINAVKKKKKDNFSKDLEKEDVEKILNNLIQKKVEKPKKKKDEDEDEK